MGREYRILNQLNAGFPYCPKAYLYCTDESVIGAEFYVMERVKGIILRAELPPELNLDEQQTRSLCKSFIDKFVRTAQRRLRRLRTGRPGPPGRLRAAPDRRLDRPLREGPDPDAPLWEPVKAWLRTSSRPITTSRASCTTTTASTT